MIVALILLPLLGAALALIVNDNRLRPWIMPPIGVAHLALTFAAIGGDGAGYGEWLKLDAPGKLVLLTVSILYCLCAFYAAGYLAHRQERPNRFFCACLMAMLGLSGAVAAATHMGLLWVAMEGSTLATAPLIYFNKNRRSIEATWKYLLIGSVGIALSLLGTFFLAYATLKGGIEPTLTVAELTANAGKLSPPWLHAAFALLLVGYGAKMGLAPMHTWKPDAYGEAPGLVGGLLAGAMTSLAFLGLLRAWQITAAAGVEYPKGMLIGLGLLSMAVAGIFVVRQNDFKRMLAWSSVEHMGILALGLGIGGGAIKGALFHMLNNGLAKVLLFMAAGNIHRAYASKLTDNVSGALKRLPVSGWLFLLGFLAASGSPPFGPFRSLFTIVTAAFAQGRWVVAALMLAFLMLVFMGMGKTVLAVVQGAPAKPAEGPEAIVCVAAPPASDAPRDTAAADYRDDALTAAPALVLLALLLALGLFLPPPLDALLTEAARTLGG